MNLPMSPLLMPEQLLGLAAACVLLIVVPGPSVLFIVGRALTYGRRTALGSVIGNLLGSYLAAVCVAVGLGCFLERSDVLFHTIKYVGAAYLIWLGFSALRHSSETQDSALTEEPGSGRTAWWRSVRAGVLVGVSNPKTFIIFAAILPPFVDRSAGYIPLQMLLLGLVPVAIGLITDSGWALAAGQARSWLGRSARRVRIVGQIGGLSMMGLGVSVALGGRER
jgi:threonine/homoserine/homoserine lactone efflux protein